MDRLAQSYFAYQYWLARSFQTANSQLTPDDELEGATQMADRFNRMFQRKLRHRRDLRRYSPLVTINNPKQVNIAAEGGLQVDVQQKKSAGRRHLRSTKNSS